MFKTLLVPVDGSKSSPSLLNLAAETATAFGAKIKLLYVVEPLPEQFITMHIDDFGMMQKVANGIIEDALKQLNQAGILESNIESHTLEGDPASMIIKCAEDWSIDMIVMGTHGWRGLDRLLLGSTAAEVVRRSHVPVLSVRLEKVS